MILLALLFSFLMLRAEAKSAAPSASPQAVGQPAVESTQAKGAVAAQEIVAGLTAKDIVDRGQEWLRGIKSSHARVSMRLIRPKFTREMEVESFHQGRDKSFIVIHKPPKEKGNRTLRVKQDIWTYTRNIEQAVKIPFSMMHTSWMGSDFTYEDMTKLDSFVTDYTHHVVGKTADPQKRGDFLVTIELRPKPEAPVVWGKVIWSAAVSADGKEIIPVAEQDYSERGELIREIALEDIKMMGGKRIPVKMTCVPLKKSGQKTVIEYLDISFDKSIDPKIFTKETLEKGLK